MNPQIDALRRVLLAHVEAERSRLSFGPGTGLEGLPHRYLRLDWTALPTLVQRACGAAVGELSERSRIAAWLHVVPTGGFILPSRPAVAWAPPGSSEDAAFEELVLTDGSADGATILDRERVIRIDDAPGARLICRTDAWYWVRPVLGSDRISLAWLARP